MKQCHALWKKFKSKIGASVSKEFVRFEKQNDCQYLVSNLDGYLEVDLSYSITSDLLLS